MKKSIKFLMIFITSFSLFLSSVSFSDHASAHFKRRPLMDMIIVENVPEASIDIQDNQLQLNVLHLYKDGHFEQVTQNLEWKSKNKNVATVDENGLVTFTGQNGRSIITVTDGTFTDEIAVHNLHGHQFVIKQQGKKYNIIDNAIKTLSLKEKIGQMLMPDFRNWNGENVTEMQPEIRKLISEYHIGGVILFRENVVTTEQTAKLVAEYQKAARKFGMLITIDQEGGIVTRLQSGTDLAGNMALGATRSTELAEEAGRVIGEELSALGINMNLAPVLDVNNNPDNPVIGVRSFSESPELVAELGTAYIKGLQSTGTAATAKHFPGHGDTAVDSHLGLPEVPHDKERLLEVELYPFQQAMDAGIDAVMTAHVTFPKIDDTKVISKKDGSEIALPATLSYKVLTELMREEMGFEGVIITDALNMAAITDHFGPVDAVIRAVNAGTDIVLMPVGLKEVADGLYEAVKSGEISEARIDESVKRILTLKVKRGIFKQETPQPIEDVISNAEEIVGSPEHKAVEAEISNRSITLVKNDNDVLPLQLEEDEKLVVVGSTYINDLYNAIKAHHENTTLINASAPLHADQLAQLEDASAVIIGSHTSNVNGRLPSSNQMQMINQIINEVDVPVISVAIRNPYDIMAYPNVDAYLAQYSFRTASFNATADTIFGKNNPSGLLPVTIPDMDGGVLYEFGHGLSYE